MKQRSFASDISVSFVNPLLNVVVDFVPVKATDKSKQLKIICPLCETPTSMSQRYLCEHGHGPFAISEADRAREIDKVLYRVTEEEISQLKGATIPPEAGLSLRAYEAEEVEAMTRPSESAYRLRPKGNLSVYAMLVKLAEDTDRAFIGEVNLRGNQKMFRVQTWNGQLVAQELTRPDDLAPMDDINPDFDDRLLATAEMLVSSDISTFVPEEYRNTIRERSAMLDEAKRDPNAVPVTMEKVAARANNDDLLALLEQAVEAAKPTKKNKKKVSK